ncbi:hypothetical protein [Moorena sp. SIO3A5]|uniref:hypothetical protein n=2 Tax=unclassified Moorena TaxID=2683338 RepID=UPI00257A0A74|nr:hypothetical protein [Moorena sp. SIO3A5]
MFKKKLLHYHKSLGGALRGGFRRVEENMKASPPLTHPTQQLPNSRFPIPVPLLGGVRGGFRFPIPCSLNDQNKKIRSSSG